MLEPPAATGGFVPPSLVQLWQHLSNRRFVEAAARDPAPPIPPRLSCASCRPRHASHYAAGKHTAHASTNRDSRRVSTHCMPVGQAEPTTMRPATVTTVFALLCACSPISAMEIDFCSEAHKREAPQTQSDHDGGCAAQACDCGPSPRLNLRLRLRETSRPRLCDPREAHATSTSSARAAATSDKTECPCPANE